MPRERRREDEEMEQRPVSPEEAPDSDGDDRMEGIDSAESSESSQMIKKLVRYALACEYSRTPIRRDGIKEKVLGIHGREFKKVFSGAQKQLRGTFGMEMVELPTRDRNLLTADQKRKAAKSQNQKEATSNQYVLISILPEKYRVPGIITPSKVQSADGEASYIGLYTTIISIITLSGGELSDPRLRRHLSRFNAGENMPSLNPHNENAPNEKTELMLNRMVKHGYIVKVVEKSQGDDDSITWHVGPRGKMEVTNESIASFIRTVYGSSNDELEKKLQMSLKVKDRKTNAPAGIGEEEGPEEEASEPGPSTRRKSRGALPPKEAAESEEDGEE
ncbi:MAGE family-domain-containing protein [Podospora didyma]|uniref:MAGE family-domain-containing protein n=1 Tax=Podospora didyma TaxID=330526 RepID=A0AAE0P4J1_9PEZI|nr:MAGE family-domain-containing protein [Podospora didyma]